VDIKIAWIKYFSSNFLQTFLNHVGPEHKYTITQKNEVSLRRLQSTFSSSRLQNIYNVLLLQKCGPRCHNPGKEEYQNQVFFIFFFLVIRVFELSFPCLLRRCSTIWAILQSLKADILKHTGTWEVHLWAYHEIKI
jgi:hypothetical protein